jgi:hypothetical protein
MQSARLTQDYYGFFPQAIVSRKDPGAGKQDSGRPQSSVFPTERVVEGELLRNRRARTDELLNRMLQHERFTTSSTIVPDDESVNLRNQHAIDSYLNVASSSEMSSSSQSRSIDYYV